MRETRDAAHEQLETIAGRSHDPRRDDALLALKELEPPSTEAQSSDDRETPEPDPVKSGFTKCFVMLGLSDEAEARAGFPAFDYGDEELKQQIGLWTECELTSHDLSILSLD